MNVLVPCRYGGLAIAFRKARQAAPGAAPGAARLRRPEPARADAAGDGGAGRRAWLPEDDDRADREDRPGRPLDLLRAVLEQGGVLPRRLRRDDRGGRRRSSTSCSTPSSPGPTRSPPASRSSSRWSSTSRRGRSSASSRRRPPAARRWRATRGCWRAWRRSCARGASPQPAREPAARRARGGDRRRASPGSSTSGWSPAEVDEIKGLLPEMLQVTLTPYVGEVEAGRAADAAQARRRRGLSRASAGGGAGRM